MKGTKRPGSSKLTFEPSNISVNTNVIMFFAIAAACFVAPLFIGSIFGSQYRSGAQDVSGFRLNDEIHNGIFSNTIRKGDTIPSAAASYFATQIGAQVNDNLVEFARTLTESRSMERIYYGASILKAGNELKDVDAIANAVNDLREPTSGFRPDAQHAADIAATYFALETMKLIGTYEAFSASDEFKQIIDFVSRLQFAENQNFGGFLNSGSSLPSITATYHAVKILPADTSSLEGVSEFVASCARIDGGFGEFPASEESFYTERSSAAATAKGLFLLHNRGKFPDRYSGANEYLRSCLTTSGVVKTYGQKQPSLEASFHFLELIEQYPSFNYGLPLALSNAFPAIAAIAAAFGVVHLYSDQIDASFLVTLFGQTNTMAALLGLGAVAAHVFPQLAIPVYLAVGFHTAMNAYKATTTDTDTWSIIIINAFSFMIAVFGLLSTSAFIFAEVYVYPLLLAWVGFSTLASSMLSSYVVGKKLKNEVFLNAAYITGLLNTVLFLGTLFGRDGVQTVSRLIEIRGLYAIIFVATPVLMQLASYAGTSLGIVYQL